MVRLVMVNINLCICKMITCVVSRYKKNVDWVYKLPNINKFCIYDKENPKNEYNIPVNKGNEASVYLKYIVDNYNQLPDFTFFIHDDEYAWHHSGSILDKFNEAYNQAVVHQTLYYNINDKSILGSILSNKQCLSWYNTYIEPYIPIDSLPQRDWTQNHRGSAQFLVHRSLITKLPVKFYEDLYNWILTTTLPNAISGRFLEWTWHLFWDIYPKL